MVIGTPLGISPPRYGGDGPRGGGGGYGRPRTPDRYNSIHSFLCVSFNVMMQVQRRISGGAMGSARTSRWRPSRRSWRHGLPGSPAQGWTWPWSQGWFQGTTQGTSQVVHALVKSACKEQILIRHSLGVLHLVTTGATTEAQFHQCRTGIAAKRGWVGLLS